MFGKSFSEYQDVGDEVDARWIRVTEPLSELDIRTLVLTL